MPELLKNISNFLFSGSIRSQKTKRNIVFSSFLKGSNIIIGLLIVPITIDYINPTQYGIWLTISTLMQWITFFDIGLGNGLRNRFAESIAIGKSDTARSYVSTTYSLLLIILLFVSLLSLIIIPKIDLSAIFNVSVKYNEELKWLVLGVFLIFIFRFFFEQIKIILIADQRISISSFLNFLGNLLALCIIFLLTKTSEGSILKLGIVMAISPLVIYLLANFYFFSKDYKIYRPNIKYVKLSFIKDLTKLSFGFFIIQIASIIIFSSANIIITQFYGPLEVTNYNLAYKYFSVLLMLNSIIIAPLWSAFTEAYHSKDFSWIMRTHNLYRKIWLIISVGALLMLLISKMAYRLWLGPDIKINFFLSLTMCLFVILQTWGSLYVMFLNGIGKIKLQFIFSFISVAVFIFVSLFLAKTLMLGSYSIVIAMILSNFYGYAIAPIQYFKTMNHKMNSTKIVTI